MRFVFILALLVTFIKLIKGSCYCNDNDAIECSGSIEDEQFDSLSCKKFRSTILFKSDVSSVGCNLNLTKWFPKLRVIDFEGSNTFCHCISDKQKWNSCVGTKIDIESRISQKESTKISQKEATNPPNFVQPLIEQSTLETSNELLMCRERSRVSDRMLDICKIDLKIRMDEIDRQTRFIDQCKVQVEGQKSELDQIDKHRQMQSTEHSRLSHQVADLQERLKTLKTTSDVQAQLHSAMVHILEKEIGELRSRMGEPLIASNSIIETNFTTDVWTSISTLQVIEIEAMPDFDVEGLEFFVNFTTDQNMIPDFASTNRSEFRTNATLLTLNNDNALAMIILQDELRAALPRQLRVVLPEKVYECAYEHGTYGLQWTIAINISERITVASQDLILRCGNETIGCTSHVSTSGICRSSVQQITILSMVIGLFFFRF